MSCSPETLSTALAHRFDPEAAEPASWPALRDHLAACEDCRRRALAVDPSLLFDLPRRSAGGTTAASQAAVDPQAMIAAVAAMRRADRVESRTEEHTAPIRRLRRRWARYTAAAVVAAAALSYGVAGHVELPELSLFDPAPAGVAQRVVGSPDEAQRVPGDVPLVERTESDAQLLYEVRETDVDMAFFAVEDFDV